MSIIIYVATISQFSGGRFNGRLHQRSHQVRTGRTQDVGLNISALLGNIHRSPDVTSTFMTLKPRRAVRMQLNTDVEFSFLATRHVVEWRLTAGTVPPNVYLGTWFENQ